MIKQADNVNLLSGTPMDVPDPDLTGIQVHGDNILIRPFTPGDKIGSIYLPQQAEADKAFLQNVGRVVAVGPLAYKDSAYKPGDKGYPHGWFEKPWVKVGDIVAFARNSGQRMVVRGVKMQLLKDSYILMNLSATKISTLITLL